MINFLKYKWLYFFCSAVAISLGLFSIFKWGYRYSIDFVGGTNLEYQIDKKLSRQDLENFFKAKKITINEIKLTGNILLVRTNPLSGKTEKELIAGLEKELRIKVNVLRSETVGPVLGRETLIKTIVASLLALLGILIYMSFAFKDIRFALAAITAMFHDFLVVIGSYSLMSHFFGAQMDLLFVTAVLTTMSFSVHDTIVIFDKIREYTQFEERRDIEYFANRALTETMVRSVNNSMTIIFMLFALVLLGGETIKFFVATLLIGTITGTYSSPFVATPLVVWMEKRKKS